ncbi:FAD-dependent monooxygenase [Streptomyces sp. MMG1121]|uniref:FAD-dependent monooxygenase n=1 Tax=Streptomyces sp. MMG1121 TaxID=1415544 RepID=UPI0006B04240|nr:FAD-dependent monooxygenase [Streptomyces sp. MMG1121]KOV61147.1 FAD-dependent oxidoreductase [Streptomyces sp. MMG1121]
MTTAQTTDVLVVGSGPTGLTLANELALAGVRVIVLDKLADPNEHSKALGLQPRTVEVLDMRGLLATVLERSLTQVPDAHFAGLPAVMSYQGWGSRHPYGVIIPQNRVEGVLEEALADRYGVTVQRSHELVDIEQDSAGVTATVTTPGGDIRIRARYLVGCDGGRSAVRKRLGVAFPGTRTAFAGVVADVTLKKGAEAVSARPKSIRDLLGSDKSQQNRMTWPLVPLQHGLYRVVWGIYGQSEAEANAPATEAEVRQSVAMRYGDAVEIDEVRWLSRFTDSAYQAERYRQGRVLLAGDAAHVHLPAAGQGLNLGVQDAMNLGWKLAAEVNGWAPEGLLDSYHGERHPIGASVVENTRAQAVLTNPAEEYDGLRAIFVRLLKIDDVNHHLAGMVSGLDIRYPIAGSEQDELVGARMPDLDLRVDGGESTVSALLRSGRGVLLTTAAAPRFGTLAGPWSDRVDIVTVDALPDYDADAVLIRPDGYVCWAATGAEAAARQRLEEALWTWYGTARPAAAGTGPAPEAAVSR